MTSATTIARSAIAPLVLRERNAIASFVETMTDQHGFTTDEGEMILRVYLKLKVAKIDYGIGRVQVKHGALYDDATLRNALAYGKGKGL